tara:strand:+ start:18790 stop:19248 length:459 start_codon:yes stop_codon:yes gene_type:complete
VLKIDVICIAHIKNNAFADLIAMYEKRINWPLNIIDLESKHTNPQKCQNDEADKIMKHINNQSVVIALDEKGKTYSSIALSKKLEQFAHDGQNHIQFIIGGADGLTQVVRQKCDLIMSFGQQTWPHALARVMLLEQIYRSQQILAGHPYHRE